MMFTRVSNKALGLALGFAVVATSVAAWSPADRLTYLTFSRPVALPNVTLAAGTYAFEVANPLDSGNIVRVRDRARRQVYYTGFTQRVDRPAGMSPDRYVLFGEAPAGAPPPIVAWFPRYEPHGYQFVYWK